MKNGEKDNFNRIWEEREETLYNHWTRSEPCNQIQLAFRNHWMLFKEIMENEHFGGGHRCLEVGCGRGTVSAYFSDAGFDCTLLDISDTVVERAKQIFQRNHLKGRFIVGDANRLPFDVGSFDVVVSIGLLEHFQNIKLPLKEQIRVLANRGLLLCYVVPKYDDNVQKDYEWINDILKETVQNKIRNNIAKENVYRSDSGSDRYIDKLKKLNVRNIQATGVYPLPMISYSIGFPFTFLDSKCEKILVKHFQSLLDKGKKKIRRNPWICDEGYGQAFLVWCYKK